MTDGFYAVVRGAGRFWVWFFFKTIDVRHPERVPSAGPVLLCINHPNNLIDSLLVGAVVPRKVHFLATATLFRNPLLGWILRSAGAIPVYRRQDSPESAERNVEAFAVCYATFDAGGLVAIYPEGTTHSEARVQRIKPGAARLALEYESRRPRTLALVPVGLTFEARKSFRGRVLVSFGPPVPVSAWLAAYREEPVKAVDGLSGTIQIAMEAEVVHVDRIDTARLVRAVEALYRDELVRELREARGLAEDRIDVFRLLRSIVDAVEHFKRTDPARVERLWQRIRTYRALLAEHRIRDDAVRAYRRPPTVRRRIVTGWEAVLGLPIFAYGVVVNWLPHYLPRWIAHRVARKETDYATTRFLVAMVAFPLFWGLEIGLVWHALGARAALLFALTLPLSGVLAFRYLVGADRIGGQLRFAMLALRHGVDARRLVAERQVLLAELERARDEYLAETRGSSF